MLEAVTLSIMGLLGTVGWNGLGLFAELQIRVAAGVRCL
jgi:hypothetical protein